MSARRRFRRLGGTPDAETVQGPGTVGAGAAHVSESGTPHDPETGEVIAGPDMAQRREADTARLRRDAAWMRADEAAKERARERLAAVRRAEALIALDIPRLEADRTAAAETGFTPEAIGFWRRKVRDLPEGERVRVLLDRERTGRPAALSARQREALEAMLLHFGPHLTAAHARRTLLARDGEAPHKSTIARWLARWREENAGDLLAVTNPDRDRSHRMPAQGSASEDILRLNQLWELDSTPADVICADGARHAIVGAIDVWSRRSKVLVVPTSKAEAIGLLMRRCMLEWGVPEAVRTDEGKDYTSQQIAGVLADLEIAHERCPPYTPEAKPHIERFLGTLTRALFANLPGFTGHDVAQAQALRSRKSFAQRRHAKGARNQGRQDDAQVFRATLTADALQDYCDRWCRNVYERDAHGGLGGASPFDRVCSWTQPAKRIEDERALDALLALPAGGGWRTVTKAGIRLDKVDYIAAALGELDGERVAVRYDPASLDRIFVYRADGTFVCVAEDPARTGAERAAIAAEAKARWRGKRNRARKRARDLAKRHKPERSMDDILDAAEAEAERVVALPAKGKAHETPALRQAARAAKAAEAADEAGATTEAPRKRVARNARGAHGAPNARGAHGAKPSLAATALRLFDEEDDEWQR